jgi:RNA polymerase sigma factor (sigma-70 family)
VPFLKSASDAQLLAAVGRDPEAFAAFYDRYEAAVVGYFMRRTHDPELTADLTAEAFAAALGAAARYRPIADTAAAWLFTIAHNTLATSIRKGRVEDAARRRAGMLEAVQLSANTFEQLERVVAGDAWVSELLAELPAEQRDAVRARVLDERGYEEIASYLQTSPLVIRKRVSRGLARLRDVMEENK